MKIALVAWDLDREAAGALARLGADVVAFTRWFPGESEREAQPGWLEVRCPHQVGGEAREETAAFGVAVVRAASTSGLGFDFDVVHALDRRGRPAACELVARGGGRTLLAASNRAEDETADFAGHAPRPPDVWLCDHPWGAERLRARLGTGAAAIVVVPTRAGLGFWTDREGPRDAPAEGPNVVVTLPEGVRVRPLAVAEAFKRARGRAPGLVAAVYGTGPAAARLQRLFKADGLLSPRWGTTREPGVGRWNGAVSQAAALATPAVVLVDDPFARASWLLGTPAVSLAGGDPDAVAAEILAGLFDRDRREADVRVGAALEGPGIGPDAVAASWLRTYRRLRPRRPAPPCDAPPAAARPSPVASPFPELRSRLALTPISPREVVASWSIRPDDWRVALQWLGPEAVRAALVVRLFDVTDVAFDGLNAHGSSDVDVGPDESSRTIALPFDGRSLAACLGVRSRWGYFHPLTHCRVCHLPREGLAPAPTPPPRRLRATPPRP